jgi:GAF domain-containing protein
MKARDKSAGSQKAANLDGEVAELRRRLAAREAELAEALAQQTATAEILETINSSPGDLAPVFDAILEKAHTLCGADKGALAINESGGIRAVATRGLSEAFASLIRKPQGNTPGSPNARLLAGKNLLHIPDIRTVLGHIPQAAAELEGVRTILFIPLRKDRALLGYITAYRQEIRPFTDKQIALLQNFAAQAVIAMENARLLTETREALEQQIATAEVLGVINSSPGDLAPVFDAILEKAHSLCGIDAGSLQLYASGHFHASAIRGMPETFAQVQRRPYQPPPGSPAARLVAGERIVHVADISETVKEWAGDPRAQAVIEQGLRTVLFVPLRKDTELLGYISAFRKEIRPFTEKQIALLQNFAAQAVIAMENARLITETREALDQQTATAEVLGVINSSPGDLAPVFDSMLEKATRLCDAAFGSLLTYDGEHFENVALVPDAFAEFAKPGRAIAFGPGTGPYRLVAGELFVHVIDGQAEAAYREGDPAQRALIDLAGARTWVTVPLRKDDELLGAITVFRQEVKPFTDKQIALLQNFAAQAVIAMENARLLGELRQRTDEVAELNRGLEARVRGAARRIGPGRTAEALSRAAIGRDDRVAGRRAHPRKPSPRDRRRVLRSARLHRLRRDRRARRGARSAARISCCFGAARQPLRGHARSFLRRRHHGVLQRSGAVPRPGRTRGPDGDRDACRRRRLHRNLAQARARARLRRRHRAGLRDLGPDRLCRPLRLHGDRHRLQSRRSPVRRSEGRADPAGAPCRRRRRGDIRAAGDRQSCAQGADAAGLRVQCDRRKPADPSAKIVPVPQRAQQPG